MLFRTYKIQKIVEFDGNVSGTYATCYLLTLLPSSAMGISVCNPFPPFFPRARRHFPFANLPLAPPCNFLFRPTCLCPPSHSVFAVESYPLGYSSEMDSVKVAILKKMAILSQYVTNGP